MFAKQKLRRILKLAHGASFAVKYWDGTSDTYGPEEPKFTLIIHDPEIMDAFDEDIELGFGEAYAAGRIDVNGDLADVVSLAGATYRQYEESLSHNLAGRLASHIKKRSKGQQKQDVERHYDLGNDFFRLWLDSSMSYSCAYFHSPTDTIEDAQSNKIDYSLRKLRLKQGETLLDIGCGWGALVMRAARTYGARCTGITLSEEQVYDCCRKIESEFLQGLANVRLLDYQSLAKEHKQLDKIVSIGMIEHVGKAHLAEFVQAVSTMLRPGGLALLHFITSPQEGLFNPWMERYIFPGAYLPTVQEMLTLLASFDLRVLDVENLRPHYQLTLDRWTERFEQNVGQIREMFGEEFVRTWRLYLRSSSSSFRDGIVAIHQILVSNGKTDCVPLTREDLYI